MAARELKEGRGRKILYQPGEHGARSVCPTKEQRRDDVAA